MKLENWLETAYSEGRISIAEAINVQRSANADWRVLLADKKVQYQRARQIIGISLERRLPLAAAITEFEQANKPKKKKYVSPKLPKPPDQKAKRRKKKKPKIRQPKVLRQPKGGNRRSGKVQNVWNQFQQTGYFWRRYRS